MSNRLDQEREARLQPKRIQKALDEFNKLNLKIVFTGSTFIDFWHNMEIVRYYPYSGWASGKSIKDGRGLKQLLEQLK